MYARVVTGQVRPDKVGEAIQHFRGSVVPALKQRPGHQGSRLLTDPKTGKLVVVSFWDAEPEMLAGDKSGGRQQEWLAGMAPLLMRPPIGDDYEIALRIGPRDGHFARMSTFHLRPAELPEAINILRDITDLVTQQAGNKGLTVITNAQTGQARVFTIWETEAAMVAGERSGFYQQQRAKLAGKLAVAAAPGEHFEVSVRA